MGAAQTLFGYTAMACLVAGCSLGSFKTRVQDFSGATTASMEQEGTAPTLQQDTSTPKSNSDSAPNTTQQQGNQQTTFKEPTTLPNSRCSIVGKIVTVQENLGKSVKALAGASATLLVDKKITETQSITVPSNVQVCISTKGVVDISANVIVRVHDARPENQTAFTGAGRLLIQGTKMTVVYPKWFGAKGDGATDDAQAFRKMLDSVTETKGVTLQLSGARYAMTLNPGLVVPAGNGIDGSGAQILAKLTGDQEYAYLSNNRHMFQMRSNTFLKNLTLDNIAMPRSANSVFRHHIQVGEYATGKGYSNVVLEGLTLKGGVVGEIGINIWGDSSNVTVRNIHFPVNYGMTTAIAVQWGWVAGGSYTGTSGDWTGHPHSVVIDNVRIDGLKAFGVASDGTAAPLGSASCFDVCGNWGIWLSAPYNVSVSNVTMGEVATGIEVYAGDFGNYFADASVKPLVGTGIKFNTVNISKAYLRGVRVNGTPTYMYGTHLSPYLSYMDLPAEFYNINAQGIGSAGRVYNAGMMAGQGFATFRTKGVGVYNSHFSNFAYGVEVFEGVSNFYFYDSKVTYSAYGGISLVGASSARSYNIAIKRVHIYDADMLQSRANDAAAITIGAATDGVIVDSCYISATTAYRQFIGIHVLGGTYHYVSNNWVDALASGGAAYGTPNGVKPLWYVTNNGVANGLTKYFGYAPVYY